MYYFRKGLKALLLVGFGMCPWSAMAQGINVDIDSSAFPEGGGGVPSSSFGAAAGQAGFWNPLVGSRTDLPLRDIAGNLSGVTVTSSGFFTGGGWNNPVNTGDFRLLLNDADDISSNSLYSISGLTHGTYAVYTYAVMPAPGFSGEAFITVPGSLTSNPQRVAGTMPGNQFIQGVTHSVHYVVVTDGTLVIRLEGPWQQAFVNGFQIVPVPEPATVIACTIGFVTLVCRRRRRI